MVQFQAKDVQRVLGAPKIRYEYLAGKMGIHPAIEEVEGTGRAHLYSLANLFEFMAAHQASSVGLSPRLVRRVLSVLKAHAEKEKGLFTESDCGGTIHVFYNIGAVGLLVTTTAGCTWDFTSFHEFENALTLTNNDALMAFGDIIEKTKKWDALIESMDAYTVINFGLLKKKVLERI